MRTRRIDRAQVMTCLRRGVISEGPYLHASGCWRMNVTRLAAGEEVTVTVEFQDGFTQLDIVTAF
jgi:hypothetical protein